MSRGLRGRRGAWRIGWGVVLASTLALAGSFGSAEGLAPGPDIRLGSAIAVGGAAQVPIVVDAHGYVIGAVEFVVEHGSSGTPTGCDVGDGVAGSCRVAGAQTRFSVFALSGLAGDGLTLGHVVLSPGNTLPQRVSIVKMVDPQGSLIAAAEPVAPVELVVAVEPVAPVEPVVAVEPVAPVEPVVAVKPVAPVEPVAPVGPVEPIAPAAEPVEEVSAESPVASESPGSALAVTADEPTASAVQDVVPGAALDPPPTSGPAVDQAAVAGPEAGALSQEAPIEASVEARVPDPTTAAAATTVSAMVAPDQSVEAPTIDFVGPPVTEVVAGDWDATLNVAAAGDVPSELGTAATGSTEAAAEMVLGMTQSDAVVAETQRAVAASIQRPIALARSTDAVAASVLSGCLVAGLLSVYFRRSRFDEAAS